MARGELNNGAKLTRKQVLTILKDGRRHREIAADYGIHRSHVSTIKQGKSWSHLHITRDLTDKRGSGGGPHRIARSKGERNGQAKLTEANVLAILRDPRKHREIAADYGLHPAYISMVKLGKRWPHLTKSAPDARGLSRPKLTAAQVLAIRKSRRTLDSIAGQYGISKQHVSRIKRGERRYLVNDPTI
jgi:uncharacterized protein YerC